MVLTQVPPVEHFFESLTRWIGPEGGDSDLCWKQGPYVWDSPSNPTDWPELSVPSPLGGLPVLSFLSERSLPNRTLRTALGWLSQEE